MNRIFSYLDSVPADRWRNLLLGQMAALVPLVVFMALDRYFAGVLACLVAAFAAAVAKECYNKRSKGVFDRIDALYTMAGAASLAIICGLVKIVSLWI